MKSTVSFFDQAYEQWATFKHIDTAIMGVKKKNITSAAEMVYPEIIQNRGINRYELL